MRTLFGGLAADWRFGRASKAQAAGDYGRAFALLTKNRQWFAERDTVAAPGLSLRLMNLVTLAEVADRLGRSDVLKSSLEEWLHVWETACSHASGLARVDKLVQWEKWVRHRLSRLQLLDPRQE
jgi:hypothetical protein